MHQRFLIWGIKATDWPFVVRNLVSVTKPGGLVQLVEARFIDPGVREDQPEQKRLNLVQKWSCRGFGMDIDIHAKLAGLLRDAGCDEIYERQYTWDYGAAAKDPAQRDSSAKMWVEGFRHLEGKLPRCG